MLRPVIWLLVSISISSVLVLRVPRHVDGIKYDWRKNIPGTTSLRAFGQQNAHAVNQFDWNNITPSKELIYHSCFGDHQCARLELPLDWNQTDLTYADEYISTYKGPKIALAVIRLPAKVPITDARYGGAMIINPGGPGGSGVFFTVAMGKSIQNIIDASDEVNSKPSMAESGLYFDILSFDPRGVNNTTPHLPCFPDVAGAQSWRLQTESEGIAGSSDHSFDLLWARSKALGQSCPRTLFESTVSPGDQQAVDHIAEHINTPNVVADMVALLERHGQWREEETNRLLKMQSAIQHPLLEDRFEISRRNQWSRGREQLNYWGFSYGTLLGSTFATLQPNRVRRAILDGVVDAADYFNGTWLSNISDADRIIDKFSEYCFAAGAVRCPLAAGAQRAEDITNIYLDLMANLRSNPIPVPGSTKRGPEVITFTDITNMVANNIYAPLQTFEHMARVIADLLQCNGTLAADDKYRSRQERLATFENAYDFALDGIGCADAPDIKDETKSDYL